MRKLPHIVVWHAYLGQAKTSRSKGGAVLRITEWGGMIAVTSRRIEMYWPTYGWRKSSKEEP